MAGRLREVTDYDLATCMPAEDAAPSAEQTPDRLGERYAIEAVLGRGGMAVVYRARDLSTGRVLALKQLLMPAGSQQLRERVALFEREFNLLSQLAHPRVIEVYDYGVDTRGPYYTMELLDGGDLASGVALPWRQACALAYDVCSSLALLHSRRFVHRDITPRNIHRTQDGLAKLIDFGAAVPMGVATHLVGTPAFLAPEALHRSPLDARADLFSFGASLYYVLTGELAYSARVFGELSAAWRHKPYAPSQLVDDIPSSLDELVLSLLSLEPALRPRNAFEVMQRLSAIAGLERQESLEVSRAYLTAPVLVGRDAALEQLQQRIETGKRGAGSATLIESQAGAGRSRMVEACGLLAKTLGATVLRTAADPSGRSLWVAQRLVAQLLEGASETILACAAAEGLAASVEAKTLRLPEAGLSSEAVEKLLLRVSTALPLVIIVDDVHAVDEASAALLARLAHASPQRQLVLILTVDTEAPLRAEVAFPVLVTYCERLTLPALDQAQTEALIASLFGDVPNLALVAHHIYQLARGNPSSTMSLAQWLVDKGAIRYESGGWTLPEQLSAADLPASAQQALLDRLDQLSLLARTLLEAQALAVQDGFTREAYTRLAGTTAGPVLDRALLELVAARMLASRDDVFRIADRTIAAALLAALDPARALAHHQQLTHVFEAAGQPSILAIYHLLACGRTAQATQRLLAHFVEEDAPLMAADQVNPPPLPYKTLADIYLQCLDHAERDLSISPRVRAEFRRRVVLVSVVGDDAQYWRAAPAWLAQLSHDSGLSEYRALAASVPDPSQRLQQAFSTAATRHQVTPEAERGYPPDEAIKYLVHYVPLSIAIAGRSLDRKLVVSLPGVLEPFAVLSPTVHAVRENAIAVCENLAGQVLQARARWERVYEQLGHITGNDLRYVVTIRNAVAFGIGTIEAALGLLSAERWASLLDGDPMQRVNGMYLRKIVALQQGDLELAERHRKQAELWSVASLSRQMFTTLLPAELAAHARAGDLVGVKQLGERIETVAQRSPNWLAFAQLAHAQFQQLRGDFARALTVLEPCIASTDPRIAGPESTLLAFCPAAAAYVEILVELGEYARANDWGLGTLALLHELGIDAASWELDRAVALAQGRLEQHAAAAERLAGLIAAQRALGVSGLHLGASCEARTRIAIWACDDAAIKRYAAETASEYRHGLGSTLGARYERLIDEARRVGVML